MATPQQATASPRTIVQRVISLWPDSSEISAIEVADIAYREPEIDPEEISPVLVRHLAKAELRKLAGEICREKFGLNDEVSEQHSLFPDLQKKYPKAHKKGDDPCYVPLEKLEAEDFHWNISQLRKSAQTRLRHADALEQYAVTQGYL